MAGFVMPTVTQIARFLNHADILLDEAREQQNKLITSQRKALGLETKDLE